MLSILGNGGTIPINDTVINDIASNNLSNAASWVVMLVIVGAFAVLTWRRDASGAGPGSSRRRPRHAAQDRRHAGVRRRRSCCSAHRNRGIIEPISGVPWVVLLVLGVLGAWSFLLGRTQFGRYIYAIGGNAEAARRAGINVSAIRTLAFTLTGFTAGIAGIVYASRLRSISTIARRRHPRPLRRRRRGHRRHQPVRRARQGAPRACWVAS